MSFYTRYYNNSDTERASSRLYQLAVNYTEKYASSELKAAVRIKLVLVPHNFKQESVVIRLNPKNVSSSDAITIIGAHCDSINLENPFLRAPGADDDGSGTVTVLEAYREEGGLLGSLDIPDWFVKTEKSVRGMMQFDGTAWFGDPGENRRRHEPSGSSTDGVAKVAHRRVSYVGSTHQS
ncbi:hypothetical protein BT96DRAFT_994442 [Gymnopus androsaceus JB14]|uniref:Peptide hydrolase n=1 Tax=Gymnopus androsaceus JB14 TaxID=1447944 RepID=A0A6A4HPB8_9AGAR|nr:hypothetical protein BT96DRAFT_994442 [Gymnopus androsaceus JB14]